jgi:four helix bundle protein
MRDDKGNVIVTKSFEFAIEIVRFCELLEENRKFVVARQLLKAGTSIGANIREAQNAESKTDFIHKIKLAAKEADETEYWLLICKESETCGDVSKLLVQIRELIKILSKIISTSKSSNSLP